MPENQPTPPAVPEPTQAGRTLAEWRAYRDGIPKEDWAHAPISSLIAALAHAEAALAAERERAEAEREDAGLEVERFVAEILEMAEARHLAHGAKPDAFWNCSRPCCQRASAFLRGSDKASTPLDLRVQLAALRERAEAAEARCAAAEVDRVDHALGAQNRMLDALKADNRRLAAEVEGLRRGLGELLAYASPVHQMEYNDEDADEMECKPDCTGCRHLGAVHHARQLLERPSP